ncbi:MAG: alpha-D-ribose 1-methylphosphonate 5-triphosphate synthase subunit PhnH [Oleiphilaceae bacterium]|jgi:alpha-D-ribose 1-methylphosphonate 5-triphosphate synthase subunit PhnH
MMPETIMLNVSAIWLPDFQQQNFRAILEAMARPGSFQVLALNGSTLKSDVLEDAYIAVLASLLDNSVTVADPNKLISQDYSALLQAKRVDSDQADFIMCRGDLLPDFEPKLGTLPSPELSATIILNVEKIDDCQQGDLNLRLTGPGINGQKNCAISGLDLSWLGAREEWISSFPLGVDLLLVDDTKVMALPRTTKVEQV